MSLIDILERARPPAARKKIERLVALWRKKGNDYEVPKGKSPVGVHFCARVNNNWGKIFRVDVGGRDRPGDKTTNVAITLLLAESYLAGAPVPKPVLDAYLKRVRSLPGFNQRLPRGGGPPRTMTLISDPPGGKGRKYAWCPISKYGDSDIERFVEVHQQFVEEWRASFNSGTEITSAGS